MSQRNVATWDVEDFFVEGGTLDPDAPSYIIRQADQELWQAVLDSKYCNVLTSRQMGKSSLMARTHRRLQAQGIRTVAIDLSGGGSRFEDINSNKWYFGLVNQLKRQLELTVDERVWWTEREQLGPVQRFTDFLRQVVLVEIAQPIVVFIDEIDSTLTLPFTDNFFVAIRAGFNSRASDPSYNRLTFVLLGVARPADLIKERTRTPYNIGVSIDLRDFTPEEAKTLLPGVQAAYPGQAEEILERVLYWTGGHPYLTQKVCAQLVSHDNSAIVGLAQVDALVERLFLAEEAGKENNLQFIRDRIQKSPERAAMLHIYRQVLAEKPVRDEERSVAKSQLKLTGLVKATSAGQLVVRNRIYATVFDAAWVKASMPASLRGRVAWTASIVAVLTLLIVGYQYYLQLTRTNDERAQLFSEQFQNSTSTEIRLANLAELFKLNDGYTDPYDDMARKFFFGLVIDDQRALFTFQNSTVSPDKMTVIEGVYQDPRLDQPDLLPVMAQTLNDPSKSVKGAEVREAEIKAWLAGQEAAAKGTKDGFQTAIAGYGDALKFNENNPAIYLDRGVAYAGLSQYDQAVADLQQALKLSREWQDNSQAKAIFGTATAVVQAATATAAAQTTATAQAVGQAAINTALTATKLAQPSTATPTPTPTSTSTTTPTPATPSPTSTSTATNTPSFTPSPTPTPIPTTPPIRGKLAVPIDNGKASYDVVIFELPSAREIGRIPYARQPNFNPDGTKLIVNGHGGGGEYDMLREFKGDFNGLGYPLPDSSEDEFPEYKAGDDTILKTALFNLRRVVGARQLGETFVCKRSLNPSCLAPTPQPKFRFQTEQSIAFTIRIKITDFGRYSNDGISIIQTI